MVKLTLKEWIQRAENNPRFMENVRAFRRIPPLPAEYVDYPTWVDKRLLEVLEKGGIKNLYSHQRDAIDLIRQGRNVVIVTPTASGKTLCYNLPVLQRILEEKETRAIYIFPTKALAQDQLHEINEITGKLRIPIAAFTYDGDTPNDARQAIRKHGHIIITNPDMLHTGILPHHTKWQKLFTNLRYVVIDELHIYRGVFGSHMANVIRRLSRICRFYGQDPVFICCSATVANPKEHAESLLERPVSLIAKSGAPRAAKTFILLNPPVINRELGIRQSPMVPAREIAADLVENAIQTIIFVTSRLNVEVLTKYLRDRFPGSVTEDHYPVAGYRGGYLPDLRRRIEAGLRRGDIKGVVSTNALELGIDIGDLDAAILFGYPGSIASTWQQAGRAGRRKEESVAILIARSTPMDQFLVENPEYFFSRSPEFCRINPDNLLILVQHIKSAAFELPFEEGEEFGGDKLNDILEYLTEKGILHHVGSRWHWSAESYPADEVSLRSVNPENVVVVDTTERGKNRVIAEVDWDSAFTSVYEGAIYMVESQQYLVDKLDLQRKIAYVHAVEVDYYTDAMTYTHVRVIDIFKSRQSNDVLIEHGELQVTTKVAGYKKIKFYTGENIGYGEVDLPEKEMHTTGYWFTIPFKELTKLPFTRSEIIDGLSGILYCLHHLAAMILMSDVRDIGEALGDKSGQWFVHHTVGEKRTFTASPFTNVPTITGTFNPTIFLYDAYPGGIGFSEILYEQHEKLIMSAEQLIRGCSCKKGCPSCVGPVPEIGSRAKGAALVILQNLNAK
ncbi:MAG: DEAD/DEAH box helicase [Syntrophales bacterium]|nr:DEAD/DEAH box helicase [Syntrophales bacterium]